MLCPQCGSENPGSAKFCSACGNAINAEVAAPVIVKPPIEQAPVVIAPPSTTTAAPLASVPPVLVAGFALASLWRRFFAVILDVLIITAIGVLFVFWEAGRWYAYASNYSVRLSNTQAALSTLVPMVFAFLYYWLMEAAFGLTLGKAMVNIQVRRKTGDGPGLSGSMIRNLVRIIDVLPAFYIVGFFTALFSKLKQRVGDHLADTVVIKREGVIMVVVGIILWMAVMGAMSWKSYALYKSAHSVVRSNKQYYLD